MQRAVLALVPMPDIVLVDAFRVPDLPMPQRGVPHGDRRCSADASMLGKHCQRLSSSDGARGTASRSV